MQELRLVLIIIGSVAIAALLLHGLWTSRKERPIKFGEKPIVRLRKVDDAGFDTDGVGSVRVVKLGIDGNQHPPRKDPECSFTDQSDDPLFSQVKQPMSASDNDLDFQAFSSIDTDKRDGNFDLERLDIYGAPLTKTGNTSLDGPDRFETETDPSLGIEDSVNTADVSDEALPQQLIIINVQARNNQEFDGPELINYLEQYGMLYGEMDIFHRHADLAGMGKVLFSAANMFNPGCFPLDTINQFTTPGVTFFMTLPCFGEADQNFKLMLQTAQQVADQLGGLVTDENRAMLTPQRLDEYREKIKQYHTYE